MSKRFELTDDQALRVYAFIQESYKKKKSGDLVYSSQKYNCIGFTKEAYERAGLVEEHGPYFDYFASEEGAFNSDNGTIIDTHLHINVKQAFSFWEFWSEINDDDE